MPAAANYSYLPHRTKHSITSHGHKNTSGFCNKNWTLGIKQKGIMSQQQTNKQLQNLRVVRGGENDKIGKK
jgi:hypothetical protein